MRMAGETESSLQLKTAADSPPSCLAFQRRNSILGRSIQDRFKLCKEGSIADRPAPRSLRPKMSAEETCVESLDDLRELVAKTLCDHEALEPGAFRLLQRVLYRRTRPCGIQFCLAGPRSVRLNAFWEAQKRIVLFYDSAGERFARVELTGGSLNVLADEHAA